MANRNVIEFYDIPGSGGVVWSPSTWKIRYALNYKGLEYQTKWIEFPDIESTCKKLGVPPTKTRRDGSPWYTLPAIYDPSTGVALVDSLRIAEYLEKQYPDKPSLIPSGTLALHTAFNEAFLAKLSFAYQFLLPKLPGVLNPVSAEFLTRKWTMELGMPLDEFYPKPENREAEWKKFEKDLNTVAVWCKRDKWVMGDRLSYADLIVAGWIKFTKVLYGENSDEWRRVAGWSECRFERMLKDLERYETVL